MSHGRFAAMIPDRAIAIMTGGRAPIRDRQVRLLGDRLIDARIRGVTAMQRRIARPGGRAAAPGVPDLSCCRDRGVVPLAEDTDAEAGVNTLASIR